MIGIQAVENSGEILTMSRSSHQYMEKFSIVAFCLESEKIIL